MNTGFLGPAVATVLTVYGMRLTYAQWFSGTSGVATVLTVYGMRRRVRGSRGAKRR